MRNEAIADAATDNFGTTVRRGIFGGKHQIAKEDAGEDALNWSVLDLFSTSQTNQSETIVPPFDLWPEPCINHAPYFAYKKHDKTYGVVQGCCNSWNCPRCGILRAKKEYGRIVVGCRTLSEKTPLYFITITCRGREMKASEADANYGAWTNTLLTTWRANCTRSGNQWSYVQVTERQKRSHPHSHIITSWCPPKLYNGTKHGWKIDTDGNKVKTSEKAILSDYVRDTCVRVGLGEQYDISRVASVEAASRYVAKYLFKDTIFNTVWPKGWKRVRYSQSFPKLPEKETDAFVLMTREDWSKLSKLAAIISVHDYTVGEVVSHHIIGANVIYKPKQNLDKRLTK